MSSKIAAEIIGLTFTTSNLGLKSRTRMKLLFLQMPNLLILMHFFLYYFSFSSWFVRTRSASRSSYSLLKHLPEFFATWGAAARRNGDLDASKEIFEEAVQLFPDDTLLANNYANLLIDNKNFAEARDLLNKALSNNPSNESDIVTNLNRLTHLEEEAISNPPQHLSLNGSDFELSVAVDPLLYAFSKSEVDHHAESQPSKSKLPNFLFSRNPEDK